MTDERMDAATEVADEEEDALLEFVAYRDAAISVNYPDELSAAASSYLELERFAPGDLVKWKPRMRNQLLPIDDAPAIVVRYLDPPEGPGSDDEAEDLDIVLGVIDGIATFRVYSFPSHRFTRWTDATVRIDE